MEQVAEKGSEKRRALGRGLDSLLPRPKVAEAVIASVGTAVAVPGVPAPGIANELGTNSAAGRANAARESGAPTGNAVGEADAEEMIEIAAAAAPRKEGDYFTEIPLDHIDKNPYQTRYRPEYENADRPESVGALAESIKVNGLLQPITVRPSKHGRYILVMGERRCKAAQMAGLTKVPALVRTVSDQKAAEMTIVENLHRHDLNCMEQALAFYKLGERFGLTQEQIAKRVGASRESVANHLRLLKLPEKTMEYLTRGQLSFSHARVLLMLQDNDQIDKVSELAVKKQMSVLTLENLVFDLNMEKPPEGRWAEPKMTGPGAFKVDPNVRAAQRKLEESLGLKVRIRDRRGKGKIVLEYKTLEDFDRVVGMLGGKG